MTSSRRQDIAQRVQALLAPVGFDIVHPFAAQAYNEMVAGHAQLVPLATFGRPSTLALLIGNTRALFAPWLRALASDPTLARSEHPIDHWSERHIGHAARALELPHEARFSHHRDQGLVSMLHVAQAAGFAVLSPMQLALHPELGPWFALRSVIVLDAPCDQVYVPPQVPCGDCAKPCVAALERALAAYREHGEGSVKSHWQTWLFVRDACPVGREHRYHDEQIHYHYTKDLARLRSLVRAPGGELTPAREGERSPA